MHIEINKLEKKMKLKMTVAKIKVSNQICSLKFIIHFQVDSFQVNQFTKESLTGLLRSSYCQVYNSPIKYVPFLLSFSGLKKKKKKQKEIRYLQLGSLLL